MVSGPLWSVLITEGHENNVNCFVSDSSSCPQIHISPILTLWMQTQGFYPLLDCALASSCDQIWTAACSAQSCADRCKTRLLISELLPVRCETWANNSLSKGKAYIIFWMFRPHCVGISLSVMGNINNWQRAGNANRVNLSIIHLFNNNIYIFNGIMDF